MEGEPPKLSKFDNAEDSSGCNVVANNSTKVASDIGATKWTDESIKKLIKLWGDRPSLYDTRNEAYFSKNKRREAMEELCDSLNMTTSEIQQKMISLRTYYGSQHRKKLAWDNDKTRKSPFTSRWQFWIPLQFLQDHMTQKQSEGKTCVVIDGDTFSPEMGVSLDMDDDENDGPMRVKDLRQRGCKRKTSDRMKYSEESFEYLEVEESMAQRRPSQDISREIASKSDDQLFVGIILKSLAKIEEGEAKEALKLEIQNLVFRTRFGPQRLTMINQNGIPNSTGNVYCCNSIEDATEFRAEAYDLSDGEPSMTNRRKLFYPKRSSRNDAATMDESCSVVKRIPNEYKQSNNGEI